MPPSDYFARVRPLLGKGLRDCRLSVEDLGLTARVVELLAGCMLRRLQLPARPGSFDPLLRGLFAVPGSGASSAQAILLDYLRWKNPFEGVVVDRAHRGRCDARLRGEWLRPGEAPRVHWDARAQTVTLAASPGDLFGLLCLGGAVAWRLREVLMGRQPWPSGTFHHGSEAWPFSRTREALRAAAPLPLPLEGKHLMVIGCGSVGSEAVRLLHGHGARWTLVDPARVSDFNPSRQWFGAGDVGEPKVRALQRRLRPERVRTRCLRPGASGLGELRRLIEEDRPDLVLLSSGTADHAPLAALLWGSGIPHLSACAYPRARFFEVGVVLPAEESACLCCYRGHLPAGPSAPPIEDELAHFLYREVSEAERASAYRDLVAEPATCIETGRVAEVAALTACEMLRPRRERRLWLRRLIEERTTWLLGSNCEEPNPYGLTFAGQVIRLGAEDLVAFEAERRCEVCGRTHRVESPLSLGAASGEEVDAALLSTSTRACPG